LAGSINLAAAGSGGPIIDFGALSGSGVIAAALLDTILGSAAAAAGGALGV